MRGSGSEAYQNAQLRRLRTQDAYKRLFNLGEDAPSDEDRAMVVKDLEIFCNVRTDMLRPSDHATAYELGKFRVWQRLEGMRFPRQAAADHEFTHTISRGGADDGEDTERRQPGRGIADRTDE
jgi:hypothetical protein